MMPASATASGQTVRQRPPMIARQGLEAGDAFQQALTRPDDQKTPMPTPEMAQEESGPLRKDAIPQRPGRDDDDRDEPAADGRAAAFFTAPYDRPEEHRQKLAEKMEDTDRQSASRPDIDDATSERTHTPRVSDAASVQPSESRADGNIEKNAPGPAAVTTKAAPEPLQAQSEPMAPTAGIEPVEDKTPPADVVATESDPAAAAKPQAVPPEAPRSSPVMDTLGLLSAKSPDRSAPSRDGPNDPAGDALPPSRAAQPQTAAPDAPRVNPLLETVGLLSTIRPAKSPHRLPPAQVETIASRAADLPADLRVESRTIAERPQHRDRNPLSEFAMRLGTRADRLHGNANETMPSPPAQTPAVQPVPAAAAPSQSITVETLIHRIIDDIPAKRPAAEIQTLRDNRALINPGTTHSLRLQLEPVHLGRVTVVLDATGETMQVEVNVETEEAHRTLSADADAIIQALRGLGFDIDRVQISLGQQQATPSPAGSERQQSSASGANPDGEGARRNGDSRSGNPDGEQSMRERNAQDDDPRRRGVYI